MHPPSSIGSIPGASGSFYIFLEANLNDGNSYAWWNPSGLSNDDANAVLAACDFYQVPNYPGNWFGEGFNAGLRATLSMKDTQLGFYAWLLAN